jgi:hypothetical protein
MKARLMAAGLKHGAHQADAELEASRSTANINVRINKKDFHRK